MLETYFSAPKTLRRLRTGPSEPHIDAFAVKLEHVGYSPATAIRYIRAAVHLGWFVRRKGKALADVDSGTLESFGRHLSRCRCPYSYGGGKTGYHAHFGVKLFHQYLIHQGICRTKPTCGEIVEPTLVTAFREWFQVHRGVKEPTLRQYAKGAADLLQALGEDVSQWTARQVREWFLKRSVQCGTATTQSLVTSLRAFLRYLAFRGQTRGDLALAIPAIAHWRLATLPRCLSSDEVNRLIDACGGTDSRRLRDRAIVLMLVRLGLRAGDVAQLRFADIDWDSGTLQVTGKGRYQVRLPLPQDVGDALLCYLPHRPTNSNTDRLFVRSIAPHGPFASGDGVSSVVKHALKRADIETPAKGAHILRHTAATEMLRHGVPLEKAGLVLRHRSIDMTAYYAKTDAALLQTVAQPWPEVNP